MPYLCSVNVNYYLLRSYSELLLRYAKANMIFVIKICDNYYETELLLRYVVVNSVWYY